MITDPDVSVVMSVYNNADTLERCLDSILQQEGVVLELIVINDGSTDGADAILDARARDDDRLVTVHQENQGLTRSLITGCARARARWIARQDADDRSLPGRLRCLLALADIHQDAVMLSSACGYMGPQDEYLYTVERPTNPVEARRQVRDQGIGPPAHGTVMFAKDAYMAVGGYRRAFYYGQDADLWRRLSEYGGVAYASEVLYQCRLAPGDISGTRRKEQKQFGRLGRACQDARRCGVSEEPLLAEAEALCARIRAGKMPPASPRDQWMSLYHIGSLLEKRDSATALQYFREASRCNPLALRPRWKAWKLEKGG